MKVNRSEIEKLPIGSYLSDICTSLKNSPSRFLVLTADTGTGKSTAVPVSLLEHFGGQIVMLEPRRLAVLNVAQRVSDLIGEEVGKTCGYRMHLENKVTDCTRFTVVTEAILTKMIQSDPFLEGISVVVLDEFHERSVNLDLGLALLKEVMAARDDLYVVVMSATMDAEETARYLSNGVSSTNCTHSGENSTVNIEETVPIFSVPGRTYPVEVEYLGEMDVSKAIIHELMSTDEYSKGTVLVFLPGLREINKVKQELDGYSLDAEVLVLHSSVPMSEQKKILRGTDRNGDRRRVILSSAIAETSVTIPDVTVVIDSGYSRTSEFVQNVGMQRLVTRRVSEFSARQRCGRAGRTSRGKCLRLWSKSDILVKENPPEILRCDLKDLVLECALWGSGKYGEVDFMTKPNKASWDEGVKLLTLLGCLDNDGKVTDLGECCHRMGTDVRLSCVALSGIPFGKEKFSTGFATDCGRKVMGTAIDVEKFGQDLEKRVQLCVKNRSLFHKYIDEFTEFSTGFALLCGYPDRLCMKDDGTDCTYQFPSGRKAQLQSGTIAGKYIVALDTDAGEGIGRIRSFEQIDPGLAEKFMMRRSFLDTVLECQGESGKLEKYEVTCYGKLVLKKKKVPVARDDLMKHLAVRVEKEGLSALPLSDKSVCFLKRVRFYISRKEDAELREKLECLSSSVDEWLSPFVLDASKVDSHCVHDALRWFLDGDRIDREVPEEFVLENGRKRKIVWEEQDGNVVPTLEVIIQQVFGCFSTPRILGCPILLKLLSPARRPLQITSDLENFWKTTWPEVCKEMKGRYPKHNWDYRISTED